MYEDLELKAIMEQTLNETIKEIQKKLPIEPNEKEKNAITITYVLNDNQFIRRFSIFNTILVFVFT